MSHRLAQQPIAAEQSFFEHASQSSVPQSSGPDRDADHARRLAELERASRARARPLPSVDEVAERLRSREGSGCSTGPSSSAPAPEHGDSEEPPLSWRSIVAALREGEQQPVDKALMLTDSFRCATTCQSAFPGIAPGTPIGRSLHGGTLRAGSAKETAGAFISVKCAPSLGEALRPVAFTQGPCTTFCVERLSTHHARRFPPV